MKAIIDETGRKIQFMHDGRWVEVELLHSLHDLVDLAQMKPEKPRDGVINREASQDKPGNKPLHG